MCSVDGSGNGGSVNEAEMEDNGVFCSASTVVCWRRFIGDVGVVVVGVAVLQCVVATTQWVARVVA